MADASRDVVIRIKVESHAANAQASAAIAQVVKDAHHNASKAATASLDEQRKQATGVLQEMERAHGKEGALADAKARSLEDLSKRHREYWDSVIEEAKAEAKVRQDQLDRTIQLASAQVDAQEAAKAMAGALGRARMGASHLLTGVEQVARGVVLLGLASEENLEKAVRTFARFQASADILRGVINAGYGAVKMYQAYRKALEAAAAAQAALTAAELAGNVSRGRGGVLAQARGAALGRGGLAMAGIAAVPVVGQVAVGVAAGLAAITAVSPGFREALLEFIGWTDKAAEAQQRAIAFENERIALARQALANEHAARHDVQVFASKEQAFFEHQLELAKLQDQYRPNTNGPLDRQRSLLLRQQASLSDEERRLRLSASGGPADLKRVADFQKRVNDELLELRKKEGEIDLQAADERVRSAEQTLSQLRDQGQQSQTRLQALMDVSQQAFAQFATASPQVRDRLQNLERKRQAGESFSNQESQFILQNSPFRQQREAAEQQLAAQGRATAGPLAESFAPAINAARQEVREVQLRIQNEQNLLVQLEADPKEISNSIANQLGPLLGEKFKAKMLQIVADELNGKRDANLSEKTRRAANGQ